jgi:hypothetical protein
MRNIDCAAILAALLLSSGAFAGTFDVPYANPRLAITVPNSWSPNHSDDGVDAAAPDNSVFFSIYTDEAGTPALVQTDSMAILTRNGMTVEKKPIAERPMSFGGLDWVEDEYRAAQDGKPRLVRLDASHLSGKSYVQLFVWGTPEGMAKNAAGLRKILATIKLKGR